MVSERETLDSDCQQMNDIVAALSAADNDSLDSLPSRWIKHLNESDEVALDELLRMEESPPPARSRAATPRVSDELANLGKLLVFPGIRLEMLEAQNAGNGGNNMHHGQDGISTCFSSRRVGGPDGDLEDPGGGGAVEAAQDRGTTNGQEQGSESNGARLKTNGSLTNNSSTRGRNSSGELRLEMGRESTVSFHARDQLPAVVDGRSTVVDGMSAVVDGRSTVIDGRSTVVDGRSIVVDGRSTVIDNMPNVGLKIASRGLATSNLGIQHVDQRQSIEAPSITGEVN